MIEKYSEIIENVVVLTKERNVIPCFLDKESGEAIKNKAFSLGKVKYNPEYEKAAAKLDEYLHSLSFDELTMLETVMLIGRDGDEGKGIKGKALYKDAENYVKSIHSNKEGMIEYILSKEPLDRYLINGLDCLK